MKLDIWILGDKLNYKRGRRQSSGFQRGNEDPHNINVRGHIYHFTFFPHKVVFLFLCSSSLKITLW